MPGQVTVGHQGTCKQVFREVVAAAVNEEVLLTTRGCRGYFRLPLCLKAAAGLVPSKFGLRTCGGKPFSVRKKSLGRLH